jgi:hypothetical protein
MERLLQYVWKYKLADLVTTEGNPVTVIDPGIQNMDAGPDFFNAKIRMEGAVWAGNVEIHHKASEWWRHHHDHDPAYDSVILHAVEENDALVFRADGKPIPQAIIRVPQKIREHIEWLLSRDTPLPCAERIREVESVHLISWLNTLLGGRLERKTEDIFTLLEQYADDWNEVFYITLARNFGFGINGDAFERLARSLPFRHIGRQRADGLQIEALLFGQAGLLAADNDDAYYRRLQQEYLFLRKKYGLRPLSGFLFRNMRMRPVNFPHLRLAQLAAVWTNNGTLFSKILETDRPEALKECFDVSLSEYWDTHYHFQHPSPFKKKTVGRHTTRVITINTVVPLLFAYGKKRRQPEYCTRALRLLEQIPPERNSLITPFTRAGIRVESAADTQALIQLRREYCEKKKCIHCRIGFHLIKRSVQ